MGKWDEEMEKRENWDEPEAISNSISLFLRGGIEASMENGCN